MQYFLYKSKLLFLFCGIFIPLFSAFSLNIPHDIVILETISTFSFQFDFLKTTEKNVLAGRIRDFPSIQSIKKINFSILDKNGLKLWTKTEENPQKLTIDKNKGIPFKLTLGNTNFPQKSVLKITILGNQNTELGKKEKELPFKTSKEATDLSNLIIDVNSRNDLKKISFTLSTKETPLTFFPQLRIFKKEHLNGSLFKKKFPKQFLEKKTKKIFNFEFQKKLSSGLYVAEIILFDKNQKAISGKLEKEFLINGAFAKITNFETNAQKFLKEEETFSIIFNGLAPANNLQKTAEISVQQKLDGKMIDFFLKTENLKINNGKFSIMFDFLLENPASQFIIELKIKQESQLLESKIFETNIFPTPKTKPKTIPSEKNQIKNQEKNQTIKNYISNDWILWGSIIILIFLLTLNSWLKQEKKILIILITLLAFNKTTFATTTIFWNHPLPNWSFSPILNSDPNFKFFNKMKFQGNIFDNLTQKGFFQTTPLQIIVKFYKTGEEDIYLAPNSFTVQDKKSYEFELDLPVSLAEGGWSIQLLFQMLSGCGTSGWCGSNWSDTVFIDKTPPEISISFDEEIDKKLHRIAIAEKEQNLNNLLAEKKNLVDLLRIEKNNLLNETNNKKEKDDEKLLKERIKIEKEEKLTILNRKLLENALIILFRTAEDDAIKTALETEIANITTEVETLTSDIETLELEITNLQANISNLNSAISIRESSIADKETEIQTIKPIIRDIKRTAQKDFVTADITCLDNFSGCQKDEVHLEIRGNFCNDSIPKNGLIAEYKLEGNVQDSTTNNNDGTNNNVIFEAGKIDLAGNFSGGSQVEIADDPTLATNSKKFTVQGWFKPAIDIENMSTQYPLLVMKRIFNQGGFGAHFTKDDGKVNIQYCWNETCSVLTSSSSFYADTWYHYAATFDEQKLRLYINGNLEVAKPATNSMGASTGTPLTLGGNGFEGLLDEFKFYNRALSGDEILSSFLEENGSGILNNCNIEATRNMKFCDKVGNCTLPYETSLEIDWYDPVKPDFNQNILWKNKGNIGGIEFSRNGTTGNSNITSDDKFIFEIDSQDVENPQKTTYPTLFDDHACGSNGTSFLFEKENNCTEKEQVCAISSTQRGSIDIENGGECATECAPGFIKDGDFCVYNCDYHLFNGCLPFNLIGSTCEDSEWLPTPESIQSGETFVQTSNCGTTKQAIGIGTGLHQVEASLRFNETKNTYLSRSLSSVGNVRKWTWSGWIKRGKLGGIQNIFGAFLNASNATYLDFEEGKLRFNSPITTLYNEMETRAIFQDPSKWYHVVAVFDSANSDPSQRRKLYVDGKEITDFTQRDFLPQHHNGFVNNISQPFSLGENPILSGTQGFDGYLTEINFIDGLALNANNFGEYNPNNQWVPKSYEGAFGTNGFYLNFSDASSLISLGYEDSGNNNHWTLNNFDLYDSVIDSPTNNFAILNPIDHLSTGTISNGNLVATGKGVASFKNSIGKWYWEEDGVSHYLNNSTGSNFEINVTDKTVNFGQGGTSGLTYYPNAGGWFMNEPPFDYSALSSKNLQSPSVINPQKFFDIVTYLGNGVSQSISDLDFSPDLLWIKNLDEPDNHKIFDTLRGKNKQLVTNDSFSESTVANQISSIDPNGFSLMNGDVNLLGKNYIVWNWKKSISSGFDIVEYIGDGIAGKEIPHAINKSPDLIIIKNRDNGDLINGRWSIWHKDLANTESLFLNTNNSKTTTTDWNNTTPTSTFFTVGNTNSVNESGASFIAYLFKEKDGFSKIGSYTGNGNNNGPFVYTGFKPQFILQKRIDSNASWEIIDSKMNEWNLANKKINPDLDSATTTADRLEFLSNGFKFRNTENESNANGGNYIYIAFAEKPFKNINTLDCHDQFLSTGLCLEFKVK